MRNRLATACLLLPLAACDRHGGNAAPPRVWTAPRFPRQSSTIVVPLTGSLAAVSRALDEKIPRRLWSIDEHKPDCVPAKRVDLGIARLKVVPKLGCRIVGTVTRGAIRLSGRGDTLVVDLPVHATIAARDVGGIAGATATGAALVHAVAHLSIDRQWRPVARVDLRYDWTTPPGVDVLGQRIEFVKQADERLRPVVAELERTLPRELAKLKLRDQLAAAWARGFTVLSLNRDNPPAWLRVTPQRLGVGGYRIADGRISLLLAADAVTETFVGDRPAPAPPTPLPPPAPMPGRQGLRVFVPVLADYRQLEPVVLRALRRLAAKGITLPRVGPVDARFGKVTIYATAANHLAIGVTAQVRPRGGLGLATKGEVWLTAIPYNQPGSQVVRARDIRIAGDTDSRVANLLLAVFDAAGVQASIRDALTQDFGRDYAHLLADVRRAIGERREGDFVFSATVDRVENGRIVATGRGLFLPVRATGVATIAYRPVVALHPS